MTTETVHFLLHRLLKTVHDQESSNSSCQAKANARHGNLMNGGRKAFFLLAANPFGYEIGKVQRVFLFLNDRKIHYLNDTIFKCSDIGDWLRQQTSSKKP